MGALIMELIQNVAFDLKVGDIVAKYDESAHFVRKGIVAELHLAQNEAWVHWFYDETYELLQFVLPCDISELMVVK